MYVVGKNVLVRNKTKYLTELVVNVLRIYPTITTINKFKEPPFTLARNKDQKLKKMFRMLVHVSTLLNENYRVKDKNGRYMSQKEDYVNALNLMKDLVLYFDVRKGVFEHEFLSILKTIQERKGEITNRYMQEFTAYSKSHCTKIMRLFLDRGWIIRKGGNKKEGYTYITTDI